MKIFVSEKGQAMPGLAEPIMQEAFNPPPHTELRWLGSGGVMLNSRGTVLMIDPVLEGFDMPLLFEPPIAAPQVPHLDGVLITRIDNDHFSILTCQHLKGVCKSYHAPGYVAEAIRHWLVVVTGRPGRFLRFCRKISILVTWYRGGPKPFFIGRCPQARKT